MKAVGRDSAGFRVSDVGAAGAKSSAERNDSKRVETSDAENCGAGERAREKYARQFKSLLDSFKSTQYVIIYFVVLFVAFYVLLIKLRRGLAITSSTTRIYFET